MKNIPNKIYLQIGDECDAEDFDECAESYEVTWSSTRVFDNDIVYYHRKRKNGKDKK